jgi:site-specific DNA-methyltransferase (adenine-specific)
MKDIKTDSLWLMKGDCLERMKEIDSGSVDAIICDPPYNTTSCSWDLQIPFEAMWFELKRIIKPNRAIVLFGSQPFTSILITSNLKMFKYEWIWEKSKSGSAFTAKYRPVNKHENILVFGKGTLLYKPVLTEGTPYSRNHDVSECDVNNHGIGFNRKVVKTENNGFRYPITVQKFQQKWRRQDQIHPTQKPVELMEYLIKTYTNENETVLDFTMGSGTTGVACVNTNRKFIGIEMDDNYFDIGTKRILEENK